MLRFEGRSQIRLPNTDGVALARHTSVADDDIVIACGEIAGVKPQGDVYDAGLVTQKALRRPTAVLPPPVPLL